LSANHKITKMTTSWKLPPYNPETNRPLRINKGYTDDQEGKDIRNEDVVRASNGKFTKQGSPETNSWHQKTASVCPTYGSCNFCYKAGPIGKKCVCTNGGHHILFHRGYILDSIYIGELLEEELEVAKADRWQTWIMEPTMQLNSTCYELAIERKINRENANMSDDDKKELRLKRLTRIWGLIDEISRLR
jgi:hypothetical protein